MYVRFHCCTHPFDRRVDFELVYMVVPFANLSASPTDCLLMSGYAVGLALVLIAVLLQAVGYDGDRSLLINA
jgi:hypothetical protein